MLSDQELLQRYIRTRDAQAFAELAQRYAPMVYATCLRTAGNRADAEDAAQETLLQLARTPDAVQNNLGGYLYRTATNKAIEQMRSAITRRKYEEAVALEKQAAQASARASAGVEEVDEFVGTLGDELREPLVLHFFRGLSQERVAAELELSQPTVSRRIERALELLRSRLETAGVAAAPAVVLASSPFAGDALVAGQVAQRVAAVVRSVHWASAAAGGSAKASLVVKTAAAGLLLAGIGTGIVAAVGVGKGNTAPAPAPAKAPAAVAAGPATAPAAKWQIDGQKVTIDGLGTVELAGICSDETDPPTWWGPDGKKLEVVPFTKTGLNRLDLWPDRMCRRFAIQVSGPAAMGWYFLDLQPIHGSWWSGNPPMNGFLPRLDIKEVQAAFTDDTKTVTVRYGIASPKLETLLEADGRGKRLSGGEHVRIVGVRPQGQETIADFTVDGAADANIVVTSFAVTREGRWIERSSSNRNPHGPVDYKQTLLLPQDQIQKIVIQCRRYTHWITWKDVPLRPGASAVTTSVEQVVAPAAGAK